MQRNSYLVIYLKMYINSQLTPPTFKALNPCISLASTLWDIGKRYRFSSDAQNEASDQVMNCLLTECTLKA